MNQESTIEEATDDSSVPDRSDTFLPLSALGHNRFLDTQVDVVGVLTKVDPVTSILIKRDGSNRNKRTIAIVDDSMAEVCIHFFNPLPYPCLTSLKELFGVPELKISPERWATL